MKFVKTAIKDVLLIKLKSEIDFRGNFTRLFCEELFNSNGVRFIVRQVNLASNKKKYTLRGLHFQEHPYQEQKVLFCLKGEIWDVLVDIRKKSSNYGKWFSFDLNDRDNTGLFIPKGFAHGYITLSEEVKLLYLMDEFYYPEFSKGIKWNDSSINIKWPHDPIIISQKDINLPDL